MSERRRLCATVLLMAVALLCPAIDAQASDRLRQHQVDETRPVLVKPDPIPSKTANPSIVVNEGSLERPLWIDTTRVAEFPLVGGADQPAIRPAEPGEVAESNRASKPGDRKSADATGGTSVPVATTTAAGAALSPVFIDASGRPRALPGGVIVTLKSFQPPEAAQAELRAAGLTPLRPIGERMWLVESGSGLAALELADRLHAGGLFEFVQPNWWNARSTK